jgi:hypothetical protein
MFENQAPRAVGKSNAPARLVQRRTSTPCTSSGDCGCTACAAPQHVSRSAKHDLSTLVEGPHARQLPPAFPDGIRQHVIQRIDDPCYVPDWASPPYASKKAWEKTNINVGPYLPFQENQKNEYYAINNATAGFGSLTVKVNSAANLYKSDGDGTALAKRGSFTFATANVDHVVERANGGCNSCLNAQVLGEDANVGATYTGGKWIYYPATGTYKNPTATNVANAGLP